MKVIKIVILFVFAFYQTSIYSQKGAPELTRSKKVKVTKGNAYPVVNSPMKLYFPVDGKILSVKVMMGAKKFVFQVFDQKTMNEIKRKDQAITQSGAMFEHIIEINKKVFMFYNVYDKANTTEQLFVQEISVEKGEFVGSPKNILKIPEKVKSTMGYNKFDFDLSSNKSKFVVKYTYLDESKVTVKNVSKIGLATFNTDMELITKQDITMPDVDAKIEKLDFTVDSKGNSYFLLKKNKEIAHAFNRSANNNPDNFNIILIKVEADGQVNESEIVIKDYIIEDIILKENDKNEIVCAGYYRLPKASSTKGVFITKINKNGEIDTPLFYDFSIDLITQYSKTSDKKVQKMEEQEEKAGIHSLDMVNIVTLKGGGVLLTGHVHYVTTRSTKEGVTYIYHYDDIIVTKINENSELDWMKRIPKRSTFESFRLFYSHNNVYIVFTDNPENATLQNDMKPQKANSNNGYVVAHKFNLDDGEKEYLPLFRRDIIDNIPVYQFSLGRLIGISESSFMVELYLKKKQDGMFRIDFQD